MCIPCSRRTAAAVAGITNLIIGSAGLSAVGFLLFIISKEIDLLQEDPTVQDDRMHILTGLYWSVMLSYVFPAAVTLLAGIFTVLGVTQNNDCCVITAILLTIIMVFACGGILLILYMLGIEYPFLIPLVSGTCLHMIFTFVLTSFRSNDLKDQGAPV